ncbi:acyl-CoA thioesterase [Sinimarinibacterium thermocellulolyticum]|uniref:Thioesterase family protein n=1 Tax=Sinimarinibacterium thermocellulolyticum TaxID=3170016 RepID=A0ABV2ABT1_9GAMM
MSEDAAAPVSAGSDPAAYRFWVPEHVRFADLDLIGHVNNKAYATYAESGRAAFLRHIGLWRPDAARQSVVVRLQIDYRQELHYPAELRIGVRVLDIGRRSFTLGLGIFHGERCAATVVTVFARVDARTRRAVELDDAERAALGEYRAHALGG